MENKCYKKQNFLAEFLKKNLRFEKQFFLDVSTATSFSYNLQKFEIFEK